MLDEETTTLDDDLSFWRLEELIESMELLLDPITSFQDDEEATEFEDDDASLELDFAELLDVSSIVVEDDEVCSEFEDEETSEFEDEETSEFEEEDTSTGVPEELLDFAVLDED